MTPNAAVVVCDVQARITSCVFERNNASDSCAGVRVNGGAQVRCRIAVQTNLHGTE
jgi:hypothetical protein